MKTSVVSLMLGLCVSLLIPFSVVAAPVAGDIDSSGVVDAVDIQLTINAALGISISPRNGDIEGSSTVDAVDVQLVINAALDIDIDTDDDGLCDAAELNLGTDPYVADSDRDGVGDGQEGVNGTDPLVPDGDVMVPLPAFSIETASDPVYIESLVRFTDESEPGASEITGWLWEFGDGDTSDQQNPSHTYSNPGAYTVSLTVTSSDGSSLLVCPDCIIIWGYPDLTVNTHTVTLSPGAASATVLVENIGDVTLSWTAESSDLRVTASPDVFMGNSIEVSISATDFSQTYDAEITFINDADETDREVVGVSVVRMVEVPDVERLTQAEAEAAITVAGLTVGTITTEYSDTVPEGRVISQDPAAGTNIYPDSSVDLVVSLGVEPVTVPNVVWLQQPAAELAITDAGLTVGTVSTENSDTVPEGHVISQNPAAAASVSPGSPVHLVVSLGVEYVTVPNVVGLLRAAAESAMTGAGLMVGTVAAEFSDAVPQGNVIDQHPPAGTSLPAGSPVHLVVSLGSEPVTVPNVIGLSQVAAQSAITAAGLTVGTVATEFSDAVPQGNVIDQSPPADKRIAEGSLVGIVVSLGPYPGPVLPGEMVSVPAGSFEMGSPSSEEDRDDDEGPVHTVALSAYEIGKYEVTNGEYADVLNWALAQGYLGSYSGGDVAAHGQTLLGVSSPYCQISYSGGEFWVEERDGYSMEDHPVVEVSWYGAVVYCNWLSEADGLQPCHDTSTWTCDFTKNGYHLPTEAQWERAAAWESAGGGRHWRYGTSSDSISCSSANYCNGSDCCNPLGLSSYPYTSPLGYYTGSASPIGCYDMSGNVWEWCNDWYDSSYYSSSPGSDPTGPASGSYRMLRGGSWSVNDYFLRSANRSGYNPWDTYYYFGFRVTRDNPRFGG